MLRFGEPSHKLVFTVVARYCQYISAPGQRSYIYCSAAICGVLIVQQLAADIMHLHLYASDVHNINFLPVFYSVDTCVPLNPAHHHVQ